MGNILIGNGFNIEFGGREYLNSEIIKRLLHNLSVKEYSAVFADKVNSKELLIVIEGLAGEVPNILDGKYDEFCTTLDELITLRRFKNQYSKITDIHEIGMEDFFFILKLFHAKYHDPDEMIKATFYGLCWLLLDAIFNDGDIQTIFENINDDRKTHLKNTFKEFDNIFTVNYDHNIEKLVSKPVRYLHGEFNALLDQYDPSTLIGRMYAEYHMDMPNITRENVHLYCNAIMGFTGSEKSHIFDIFANGALGSNEIFRRLKVGLSSDDLKKIAQLQYSLNKGEQFAYKIILTQQKYPCLTFHQYPYIEFKNMMGDLSIAGMSPNNDDHIWKMIRENANINKVTYYYKTSVDKDNVENLYGDLNLNILPVSELW